MEDMYRELILDHARNMRHDKLLDPADFDHEEHNPLCGDRLRLTLRIDDDNIIREVGWDGDGCAISQAAASMLGEELVGMPFEDARKIDKQQVLDMIGLSLTINRVKCALLSLKVLVVGAYGTDTWELIEDED
ncbi:MAG: iron-sulfur cluster assembly scaffold protein [Aggregatilineales bacterium]